MNPRATRFLLVGVFLLLAAFAGCSGSEDGGAGPGPLPVNLSGKWTGGGRYTSASDGRQLSMEYSLTLNLAHQGGSVTGNFTFTRPVLGTRSGPGSGTAADGVITMHLEPDYDLEGTYTQDAVTFDWTEHLRTGVDLYADGSLARD